MTQKYSNLDEYTEILAKNAKNASKNLRTLTAEKRSAVLNLVAKLIREKKPEILAANKMDLEAAAGKLDDSKMDRLTLNDARIEAMAKGAEEIASFADPLNRVLESRELKNGIKISRVAVPIGAVFFIFESRPNVTIDGACLCFKAGNAVILRGGKESLNSAKCLAGIFH
jgi:glutamate-5-semialdehyde dehydrogenase